MRKSRNTGSSSSRTRYAGRPTAGRGGTSRSKKRVSQEDSTSAPPVKSPLRTAKERSIIRGQLLTRMLGGSAGMLIPSGSSATETASKFYALNATQQRPEEKTSVGLKYDGEKPPLAYIPKAALDAEGAAFKHGATKYAPFNYKNGIAVTRTVSAAIRHIYQFLDGEDYDQESKAHHLGSARANLAMALDTLANHPELDDRHKKEEK